MNIKKLSTVSLFIFGVVLISILTAGLVFYQNKKDSQNDTIDSSVLNGDQNDVNGQTDTKVFNMSEVVKHNSSSDCWIVINDNIYDITNYFGSHPGGNSTMSATCGRDATSAYTTQDPYATSSRSRSSHSSRAKKMLENYLIGVLQ